MSGLLLAGDVFLDRYDDNGVSTGMVGPLNSTQLQIQTPTDQINRTSQRKDDYGQALDSVNVAQPNTISVVFDDQPAEMLTMALLGDQEVLNQAAGSVSDIEVTLPAGQRWVSLPHANLTDEISATLASDDSQVDTSAYEVNYAAGLIRATAAGALADGGTIHLSYGYAARSGTRISGGIRPSVRCRLLLDGRNMANGKAVRLDIPMANVAPNEAVDFMATEFVSTTLNGNLILMDGEAAPFYLDYLD